MRALVVLGRDIELAVALRERLDRARVTVLEARAEDAMAVIASCAPWPWMLAGDTEVVPAGVLDAVGRRPVLLRWLGRAPAGMPRHCRTLARFGDLVDSAAAALRGSIDGVHLAVGAGVVVDGEVHVNAELEALLGEWPEPLDLPRSRFRSADALLRRSAVPVRVTSSPGGTRLEAV